MTAPYTSDAFGKPEQALLLLGARMERGAEESAALQRLLNGPVEWRTLFQMADRHRILALLYSSLKRESCLDRVPPAAVEALRGVVRDRTVQSLALTRELVRILRTFERHEIPAIPFKGPAVAIAAYGNISLRSFSDLDILIPETHLHLATQAMCGLGYRSTLRFTPQQERAYLQNECALQFREESSEFVVELHWRFSEPNASVNLPVPAFWQRAARIVLPGMEALTLATEDQLLYLCVHGGKHCWERLEWISCLAELIRANPQLDWVAVIQRAESSAVVRSVHIGLHLAHSLLGTALPPEVMERLQSDLAARRLADWVSMELFAPAGSESHYQARATRFLFMMRSRERWMDRARILVYSALKAPHPDANEWVQLPPRLAFLQRLFRPLRLIAEYSRVAWRHYLRKA